MTTVLSYPSLCCIVQYMEANWRLHVASRCPSLSKIDKSIPLRLNSLLFEPCQVTLNDISYKVNKSEEEIKEPDPNELAACGDIVLDGFNYKESHVKKFLQIKIANKRKTVWKRAPDEYQHLQGTVRKMIDSLLGARTLVIVNTLSFEFETKIVRLPIGLKFRVNNLYPKLADFRSFLHLLTPSSFPLKRLMISELAVITTKNPIVREAHGLIIKKPNFDHQGGLSHFLDLPNKFLVLNCLRLTHRVLDIAEVLEIVDFWVKNGKEVGTELRLDSWADTKMTELAEEIKRKFEGACYVELKQPTGRQRNGSKFLSIPISSHSELIINATRNYTYEYSDRYSCTLVLKVVPLGSTVTLTF